MAAILPLQLHDMSDDGLVLHDPSQEAFATVVATLPHLASRTAEINDVLRFSVVLENRTSRRIIAYGLRWEYSDVQGGTTQHNRLYWNLYSMRGGEVIEPSGSKLVSLEPGLGIASVPISPMTTQIIREMSSKERVSVYLDSVVFADGSVLGEDKLAAAERVQAYLDSEQLVYRRFLDEASKVSTSEQIEGVLRSFQTNGQLSRSRAIFRSYEHALAEGTIAHANR